MQKYGLSSIRKDYLAEAGGGAGVHGNASGQRLPRQPPVTVTVKATVTSGPPPARQRFYLEVAPLAAAG